MIKRFAPRCLCAFLALTVGIVGVLGVGGCASRLGAGGKKETKYDARYLVKTDIDRIIDTDRSEVLAGLRSIADKLYKRNPQEWKKSGQVSREAAVKRLFAGSVDFPELEGRREGVAALYAFSANYRGDRVLALMAGLIGMVYAAFENKDDFYLLDDLDAQKLYNCARNMEIAIWKLSSSRNEYGEFVLLSNELDPKSQNLSLEREFGRVIGLLDFMSHVVADKEGRVVSRVAQSIATAVFLPVGF